MTDAIFCDDCNSTVRLERDQHDSLKLKCACGTTRNTRVKSVLPSGWRE